MNLNGMKIVVDTANGAAYHIAPDVFEELGAEVVALANTPDGFKFAKNEGAGVPAETSGSGDPMAPAQPKLAWLESWGRWVLNGSHALELEVEGVGLVSAGGLCMTIGSE